jgi:hypothetical protein
VGERVEKGGGTKYIREEVTYGAVVIALVIWGTVLSVANVLKAAIILVVTGEALALVSIVVFLVFAAESVINPSA